MFSLRIGGDLAGRGRCRSAVGVTLQGCKRSKLERRNSSLAESPAMLSVVGCRATACASRAPVASWPRSAALCAVLCGAAALACPSPAAASLGTALATNFREMAPDWAVVMSLASMPVVELRGAIPVGIVVLEQHPVLVFLLAAIGNMMPVPIIMQGLGPLKRFLGNVRPVARVLDSILGRARHQAEQFSEQHVFWALALFVGVPLPGTGAWSGAIVAYVLGLPFWVGVAANGIGVLMAGLIVTMLSCMGLSGFVLAVVVISMFPLASWMVRNLAKDPKS